MRNVNFEWRLVGCRVDVTFERAVLLDDNGLPARRVVEHVCPRPVGELNRQVRITQGATAFAASVNVAGATPLSAEPDVAASIGCTAAGVVDAVNA